MKAQAATLTSGSLNLMTAPSLYSSSRNSTATSSTSSSTSSSTAASQHKSNHSLGSYTVKKNYSNGSSSSSLSPNEEGEILKMELEWVHRSAPHPVLVTLTVPATFPWDFPLLSLSLPSSSSSSSSFTRDLLSAIGNVANYDAVKAWLGRSSKGADESTLLPFQLLVLNSLLSDQVSPAAVGRESDRAMYLSPEVMTMMQV